MNFLNFSVAGANFGSTAGGPIGLGSTAGTNRFNAGNKGPKLPIPCRF